MAAKSAATTEGKKIKGRKRHILVDTLGWIAEVVVHSAGIQDRDGARMVLERAKRKNPRLKKVWADGGYRGSLIDWAKKQCRVELEIVKRSDDAKGFVVLPRRWVVERTFGWLNRFRRLSKDYERNTSSAEYFIFAAIIQVMSSQLAVESTC